MPVAHAIQRKLSNLDPLTPKQLRDAQRDQVYIYNVSPREYRVPTNPIRVIPACPKGAQVSAPLVIPGTVWTTKVKKVSGLNVEFEHHADDGDLVARDVIGTAPFKDQSENLTRMGVFIAASEEPTEEEIERAREHWGARCDELIAAADQKYSVNNGMIQLADGRSISDIGADAIEAARYRGVDRKWANKSNPTMTSCPHCGVATAEGLAFCANGDVLDEAKARKARPWLFADEKRGVGRPRNEAA